MWFVDCSCMCETQDLLDTVSHSNLLAQCRYGDGYHSNRLFIFFLYWDVWVYRELVSELTSTDTMATKKKGRKFNYSITVGPRVFEQWAGELNNAICKLLFCMAQQDTVTMIIEWLSKYSDSKVRMSDFLPYVRHSFHIYYSQLSVTITMATSLSSLITEGLGVH